MAQTNWVFPTTTESAGAGVSNPNNVWASDDTRATFNDAANATAVYSGYDTSGVGLPITGIQVNVDGGSRNAGQVVSANISLSWDGGSTYTTTRNIQTTVVADTDNVTGSNSDLWGRAWVVSDLSTGNFRVQIAIDDATQITQFDVDSIQVRITHGTAVGGHNVLII